MLFPASDKLDNQWEFSQALDFTYDTPIRDVDDLRIQTSSDGSCGNLLLFRDSFGNTLHSLLAEDFGHALFSRAQPYDLSLLDAVQADYAVVEIVERNLSVLSRTSFRMPAPQVTLPGQVQPGDQAAALQGEESPSAPGMVTITGWVSSCDVDSPLYLQVGDTVYEAFPTGETPEGQEAYPFTAYLPTGTDLTGAQVLYREEGVWRASTPSQEP